MIGPGGLLLVVSHLFAVPVSVLSVGLRKSTQQNLDVKNIFTGSQTEHRWRYSEEDQNLDKSPKSFNCIQRGYDGLK
jgi:hypothetical protein